LCEDVIENYKHKRNYEKNICETKSQQKNTCTHEIEAWKWNKKIYKSPKRIGETNCRRNKHKERANGKMCMQ
jgi:hypothetical protein